MSKKAKLDEIIRCCENRFNRGTAVNWKHGDFSDLSREIFGDTDVNISPSTLKRIFGKVSVDDDYIPQQATVDALKKYGQYVEPETVQQVESSSTKPFAPSVANNSKRSKLLFPALLLITAIVAFLLFRYWKPKDISGTINITRTEGLLPATVVFELQLPETEDSLFVNFGDKSPWQYIKPDEKNVAHIYYIPGVFMVSLQTRQQTFAKTSTYIKSNNWIVFGCHRQDDIPVHFYALPIIKTGSDSLFEVTNSQLFKLGLDTTGPVLTRLSNYTPFTQSADDFIFETTFKNHIQEKGIFCRSTQFQISGSNNVIRFRWVNAGCSQRVLNIVSEQIFKGATNDLSQFVLDLSQWTTVKLVNHQKQVSLFVNGKQIFTGSYQQSLGDMKGLFLEFEGTGVIKTCDLKSYDGKLLYHF